MNKSPLVNIPRGNTAPGVNRMIVERILRYRDKESGLRILDVPCGNGEFLDAIKLVVPQLETYGADIVSPEKAFTHGFIRADLNEASKLSAPGKFDLVTCISGVMEFDNTLSFFRRLNELLSPGGRLFVTNDNLLSIHDRLLYLFFGRFRQYRALLPPNAPTWKMLPIQNLLRILEDAGFLIEEVAYVPPKPAQWLWLPLAAIVFLFQKAHLRNATAETGDRRAVAIYPFVSLLSRHYILTCRKSG